tara:strand:+ start:1298 stop:1516 length:219 start_codon:yes stop_codon:yes gene_type:complete
MRSEWVLDVLADLRSFAEANALPLLAEQLDDTALVDMAEIASKDERSARQIDVGEAENIGGHPVLVGEGRHA